MHTTWALSELSHARKTGLTVAVEQAEPLFVPGARSAGKQRAISWCVLAHPATFQDTRWKGALSEVEAVRPAPEPRDAAQAAPAIPIGGTRGCGRYVNTCTLTG